MSLPSRSLVKDINQYDMDNKEEIGRGSFASVYKVWDLTRTKWVAMKELQGDHNDEIVEKILKEGEIMLQMRHDATLPMLQFSVCYTCPIIVTPYMENGALEDWRLGKSGERWDATAKAKCIFGIAAGMAYVHECEIIHRDLKPENVLMNDKLEPVIADFGLSSNKTSNSGGTWLFMAPEILADGAWSFAGDVDSFAVTVYLVLTGLKRKALVFEGGGAPERLTSRLIDENVRAGKRFTRIPEIPDFYWQLIAKCWAQKPGDRPTFHEILEELLMIHKSQDFRCFKADGKELGEFAERMLSGLETNVPDERVDTTSLLGTLRVFSPPPTCDFSEANVRPLIRGGLFNMP